MHYSLDRGKELVAGLAQCALYQIRTRPET